MTGDIDPELWDTTEARRALADRDVTTIYRILRDAGVPQRRIAELTGQTQSEVCEILSGRKVKQYDTLLRITQSLGIARGAVGMSYGGYHQCWEDDAPNLDEEVSVDVLRRDVMALGTLATFGAVPVFAQRLDDDAARPAGEIPMPSRIGRSDVTEIEERTEQLRAAARAAGGQARAASAAAVYYRRLSKSAATDEVRRSLGSALAELDELAGWCCFDAGYDRHAVWHYRTAIDIAHRVDDHRRVVTALQAAGIVDAHARRHDDALKLYQIAQWKLRDVDDPDLDAWLHAVSANALAALGHERAPEEIARARDGWQNRGATDRADQSYQSAIVYARLGRYDLVEQLTATVNGAGRQRPVGVFAKILRATIHVRTGEPRGTLLAASAIDAAEGVRSLRARERLGMLERALSTRGDGDSADLIRRAREVRTATVT